MSKTEKLISKIFEVCTACHGDDQPTHEEEQSRMAMSDLRNIAENVTELQSLVDENFPLEDWAEAKITKAADYVRSVLQYIKYEVDREGEPDEKEHTKIYIATDPRTLGL